MAILKIRPAVLGGALRGRFFIARRGKEIDELSEGIPSFA
jgi:hypothetical protein